MSFEEAVGRLTAYEEQIKSQYTLEANDQDKLLMASLNNKTYGKWQGKISTKKARKALNGRIIQMHAEQVRVKELKTKASSCVMNVVSMDTLRRNARNGKTRRKTKSKKHISSMTLTMNLHYFEDKSRPHNIGYLHWSGNGENGASKLVVLVVDFAPTNVRASLSEVNSHAKIQSNKAKNSNNPVEQKRLTQKPVRKIFIEHRFSPNKTFAVYEKTSPRSDLRWKSTGRIFKTVGLRWVPTGKILASCTSKDVSEPTHEESIDSDFARFNTILTSLKACDECFSSKNYVRKFLRALHPKWRAKVMAIKESKDLGKKERVKSIALKANKESSDDEISTSESNDGTSTSRSDDEEYSMAVRNFKKFFRRKVKFVRQPREEKKSFRQRDEKKGKSDQKCFRCGDPNHLIRDFPKPTRNKDQKAFIGGSWSDDKNDAKDKTNDETCLMAQSKNRVTLNSSYYSDNSSSLDNDTMQV
uniref:Zf-CCHC domain-containing protein/UBN2 domain-containing protein n=1 Tax=Tanacetum cinerariifolium TaxID=118510 RepID=A0A6L2NIB8_TANCI|nr:zf-CCHC domain-containing protein/UBN2 domain-containing protein [Tanacetum cinerariifolium]